MDEKAFDAVLCYVSGCWAFFTTRELNQQWGDDWNDAPYEHNAGWPYSFDKHDAEKGREPWDIYRVAWDGPLDQPCEGMINSPFSVEQINSGAIAWLRSGFWSEEQVNIFAGTTMRNFIAMVAKAGGKVYLPVDADAPPRP